MANFITRLFKGNKGEINGNTFKFITMDTNSRFIYNGRIYESDTVRSCIRPYVKGLGKTVAKHIRESVNPEGNTVIAVNPDAYIRFMLEEPNPYMTFQKLVEKMATSLILNNDAFALLIRDDNGLVREIYPMPASGAEAVWLPDNSLGIRFFLANGNMPVFRYTDLIHLRGDFYEHDIFGDPLAPALMPLMECIGTIDRGLVNAIKNSSIIRWILKFTGGLRDEDIAENAARFAKNYLEVESASNVGVAATDSKADIIQVEPKDYVPNAALFDRQKSRIFEIFNTNQKIVQSSESEDEWNSYYEHEIEPDVRQMSDEFTRKIFSRRERGCGNRIVFEAGNLSHASFRTKLELAGMVDRGGMTVNQWRYVFNMSPIPGGDQVIRRLDTAVVNQVKNLTNKINGKNPDNDRAIIDLISKLIDGR